MGKEKLSEKQWDKIKELYCANVHSITDIAKQFKVSRDTLRSRANRQKWVRIPKNKKAKIVQETLSQQKARRLNEAASLGSKETGSEIVDRAIDQDLEDMNKGLSNARAGLVLVGKLLSPDEENAPKSDGEEGEDDSWDPRDIKTLCETNLLCVSTIRKIRGLDEKADPEDDLEGWTEAQLKAELDRLS